MYYLSLTQTDQQVRNLIKSLNCAYSQKYAIIDTVANFIREKFCEPYPPYNASYILKKLGIETKQLQPHNLDTIASKYNIELDEIDGIYFANEKKIFYTKKSKSEFTKAHEIFEHFFFGFRGYEEKHFNYGAAEFLMPEKEFTGEALSVKCDLYYLKDIYPNCSPVAIATRLLALRLIDNFTVTYKNNTQKARQNIRCNKACQYNLGKDYRIVLHWSG